MISDLPKFIFLSIESFDKTSPVSSIKTETETGPPKIRPLQNFDSHTSLVQFYIEVSDYKSFFDWWKEDMNFGQELLRMRDPLSGELSTFRIENDSFTFTALNQNILTSAFQLRSFND